jgi:protein CpxP
MKASRLAVVTAFCVGIFSVGAYAQVAHDGTLASLHAALNLTASQEDSWRNFAQAYTPDQQEMVKRMDAAKNMATLTAPQRIDLSIDMAEGDLAELKRRGGALKDFYGVLSPQQRVVFDRETMPPAQGPTQGPN